MWNNGGQALLASEVPRLFNNSSNGRQAKRAKSSLAFTKPNKTDTRTVA
jgi:hypothetical protein